MGFIKRLFLLSLLFSCMAAIGYAFFQNDPQKVTSKNILEVQAFDSDSGLAGPPTATSNGQNIELKDMGNGVFKSDILPDGPHHIEIQVSDKAGHITKIMKDIIIETSDIPPPTPDECEALQLEIVQLKKDIEFLHIENEGLKTGNQILQDQIQQIRDIIK